MTGQPPRSAALTEALTAADLAYTEPARARRLAESAMAAAAGDAEVTAAAERALGMAAAASGDFAGAADRLRNAAHVADMAGLPTRAGEARGSLAFVLLLTSGARSALAELDRADATLRAGVSAARLQMQRGIVLTEIRHFDEAKASLDRALKTLEAAGGDDLLEADIRNNRAFMFLAIGAVRMRNSVAQRSCMRVAATSAGRRGSTTTAAPSKRSVATCRPHCPPSTRPPEATGKQAYIPACCWSTVPKRYWASASSRRRGGRPRSPSVSSHGSGTRWT